MPITAWLPFAIAVFGIYDASALFLIGLGAFYPIVVNTTHGVRDTNLLLLRAARMLGAGTVTILAKVVFPSALPSIDRVEHRQQQFERRHSRPGETVDFAGRIVGHDRLPDRHYSLSHCRTRSTLLSRSFCM